METLRTAAGLLTRWPVTVRDDSTGARAFAIVGAAIGALGAIVVVVVGSAEPTLGAVLAIGTIALASGGLHLDGLSDTADALAAPDAERAETARRDPSAGAAGVVAMIVVIGGQIAALASLAAGPGGPIVAGAACVASATAARTVPVVGGYLLRRRARPDGFGGWFAGRLRRSDPMFAVATLAGVLAIGLGVGSPPMAVLAAVPAVVLGTLVLAWIVARRGQLDGDGLGAAVELTMLAGLAIAAVAV